MYSQYPQPQPYPPPQPEKKPNYWLIGCFGCGGALALVAGIVIIFLVVVSSGDDSGGSASDQPSSSAGAGDDAGSGQEETAPADDEPAGSGEPVEVVAEPAEYEAGALSQGGDFVAVHVTITNNSDEPLSVNPLYFSMEDANGQTQDADLMESAGQEDNFEALDLANGESESGVVVFPGTSEPVSVTHTGVMGDSYTAEVA
ncbi:MULTISPECIES: DUF4352 domain-containing protein [Streptomonospora]|uniref:DUF4352 domain-containing protein n=2 Tax=Streptomonospora TaxID=104204 RepID=A0ABV9SQA8_9ACTN